MRRIETPASLTFASHLDVKTIDATFGTGGAMDGSSCESKDADLYSPRLGEARGPFARIVETRDIARDTKEKK
jgi:hypothetical protein